MNILMFKAYHLIKNYELDIYARCIQPKVEYVQLCGNIW